MTDSEFAGLALSLDPVRGVRSFRIANYGHDLTGVVYKQRWNTGENVAQCRKFETFLSAEHAKFEFETPSDTRYQTAPSDTMLECRHGFYAYYDGSSDFFTSSDTMLTGIVNGYGEVLIGTRGFRSMKAEIIALHIPEKRALVNIRRNYSSIPIFDSLETMVKEFPTTSGFLSTDEDPRFWSRPA